MRYNHNFGIDSLIGAVTNHPGFVDIAKYQGSRSLRPYCKLSDLPVNLGLYLESELGDFLKPADGGVHSFFRGERLSRLPDGDYSVKLASGEIATDGRKVHFPERKVIVNHRRTHHSSASFDKNLFLEQSGDGYKIEYDENFLGDRISRVVNVGIVNRDVSSVYSDFRIARTLPDNWEDINVRFEEFYKQKLGPHLKIWDETARKSLEAGENPRAVTRKLNRFDAEFFEENKELILEFRIVDYLATLDHSMALSRLFRDYSAMMGPRPFNPVFRRPVSLIVDSKGRMIQGSNLGYARDLFRSDVSNGECYIEGMPFNDLFKSDLQKRLGEDSRKFKDYERKALSKLEDSFKIVREDPRTAHTSAQTALEVIVKGFLKERGILVEGAEQPPLSRMLGAMFDEAVSREPGYSGRRRRVFPSSLYQKLFGVQDSPVNCSFTDIRNKEIHEAGGDTDPSFGDQAVSQIGCVACADAVNYIINEGWNRQDISAFETDLLIWRRRDLKSRLPLVEEHEIVPSLKAGLREARVYLTPEEINLLRKAVRPYSWAYDELQRD
ncbi:MAG: hypothetical protein AABY16_01865 [Nanoarchaeota archaeon]